MTASLSTPPEFEQLVKQAVAAVDAQPVRPPERRSAPRVPCSMPVQVRRNDAPTGAVACDLSAGGMAIELRGSVLLGEVLALRFAPPGADFEVECAGLVRSVLGGDAPRVGVEFHNLCPDLRRSLAGWVREQLTVAGSEARAAWAGRSDLGVATSVERSGMVLRWPVPFPSLWPAVARVLASGTTFFVPTRETDVQEGDRILVEVVPPDTHAVLQLQAEVTWVAEGGLGLRHAGLTLADRGVLASITAHFVREGARYR
jgi:hypothetical protein